MIHSVFICALAITTITAAPQFVTFKDGKIGVNFAGFSADAGLGGLLTGNAAHGGLSASAGTPFGQRAAAGIGGLVDGDAAGRAYAGAQATDSIGASAIIGGSTGPQQHGLLGAEAHSNGNSVTKTITSAVAGDKPQETPSLIVPTTLSVQKIKPPKKYIAAPNVENSLEFGQKTVATSFDLPTSTELQSTDELVIPAVTVIKNHHHHGGRRYKHVRPAVRRHFNLQDQVVYAPLPSQRFNGEEGQIRTVKTVYKGVQRANRPTLVNVAGEKPESQDGYQVVEKDVQFNPGYLNQFFNIPIGILQSIRDNLQPVGVRKQVTYTNSA